MNCRNCGAPIHGSKCEYCGTVYEQSIHRIVVDKYPHGFDTLACKTELPLYYTKTMSKEELAQNVKHDIAVKMSERLCEYMDVETWVDPETMTQFFGGKIRVARP